MGSYSSRDCRWESPPQYGGFLGVGFKSPPPTNLTSQLPCPFLAPFLQQASQFILTHFGGGLLPAAADLQLWNLSGSLPEQVCVGGALLHTRQWPQINSPLIFGKSRTQSRSICNQSQSGFWPCLMSTSSTQKNGSFNNSPTICWWSMSSTVKGPVGQCIKNRIPNTLFSNRPVLSADISACMFCLVGNHLSGGGQRSDYHLQPFHWISTEPLNGNLGTSCK